MCEAPSAAGYLALAALSNSVVDKLRAQVARELGTNGLGGRGKPLPCAKATVAARLLRAWVGGVLGRGGEFFQVVVYDFGDSDLLLVLLQSQELLELFS